MVLSELGESGGESGERFFGFADQRRIRKAAGAEVTGAGLHVAIVMGDRRLRLTRPAACKSAAARRGAREANCGIGEDFWFLRFFVTAGSMSVDTLTRDVGWHRTCERRNQWA